eukprot:scaffold9154_cov152-Isochrysis_galbana.AAC.3
MVDGLRASSIGGASEISELLMSGGVRAAVEAAERSREAHKNAYRIVIVVSFEAAGAGAQPSVKLSCDSSFVMQPMKRLARVRVKSEPDAPPVSPALALFDDVVQGDVPSASESGSSAARAPSHDHRPAERQGGFSAPHA